MKEFTVTGTLTLEGVTFRISAKSLDDAWVRLAAGEYDSYDTDLAEIVNHHVALSSIEENV